VGVKNVTVNEPFFEGHFPGQPVMPGRPDHRGHGANRRHPACSTVSKIPAINSSSLCPSTTQSSGARLVPGDQLVFELAMTSRKSKICLMSGKAFVDGTLVAEADLMASIIDRNDTKKPTS